LIGSVLSVDHTTARAALARVAGVDCDQRDASARRLVGDEGAELMERPGMQAGSLTAPGRYPPADALQIFQGNATFGAFSSLHDRLRNAVVGVFTEPGLLACHPTETALRRLGASLLKSALAAGETVSDPLHIGSGMDDAVAVGRERDDTEVNAEPVGRLELLGFRDVAGGSEHPLAPKQAEIDFALAVSHQPPLVLAHHDRDGDAAFNGPQTDRAAVLNEADNAVVVGLGSVFAEHRRRLAADLEGVGDLGDRAHSGLSGQTEAPTHVGVSQFVQIVLPEDLTVEADAGKPRARLVAAGKRRSQADGLFARRQHLQGSNKLQALKYGERLLRIQVRRTAFAPLSLPALKDRASRGEPG